MQEARLRMICATHGRPEQLKRLRESFYETILDRTLLDIYDTKNKDSSVTNMTEVLNYAFKAHPTAEFYGFIHDDHVCKTVGWDKRLMEATGNCGISYPNDLWERSCEFFEHPSSWVMTGNIPRSLGYILHRDFEQIGTDMAIRDLGKRLGTFVYLKDVIIEHMHYRIGKSEEDESYKKVYDKDACIKGQATHRYWLKNYLPKEVKKVKAYV